MRIQNYHKFQFKTNEKYLNNSPRPTIKKIRTTNCINIIISFCPIYPSVLCAEESIPYKHTKHSIILPPKEQRHDAIHPGNQSGRGSRWF